MVLKSLQSVAVLSGFRKVLKVLIYNAFKFFLELQIIESFIRNFKGGDFPAISKFSLKCRAMCWFKFCQLIRSKPERLFKQSGNSLKTLIDPPYSPYERG